MKISRTMLAAGMAATILAGCASLAQSGAISRAYSAIEKGRYDKALARLSEAERYTETTPQQQAEISWLRARSFEGMGMQAQAVGSYRFVVEHFADTSFGYQASERLKALGYE